MSVLRLVRPQVFFLKKEAICTTSFKRENIDNKIRDAEVTESEGGTSEKIRPIIDLETSLRYMKSKAYQLTYGDNPVWHTYVRNFKGSVVPPTRKSCLHGDKIATSSPCPICRDEYLVVDYRNIDLIKQFISPHGEYIIDSIETGVCQRQHRNLVVAITKARNYGFLTFSIPHRHYNYSFYMQQ